jgi:hypothetical protein
MRTYAGIFASILLKCHKPELFRLISWHISSNLCQNNAGIYVYLVALNSGIVGKRMPAHVTAYYGT